MRSGTTEKDLEIHIEKSLTGTHLEELKEQGVTEAFLDPSNENNFYLGFPNDFNKTYALDEKRFWHFLESTQEEELEKLKRDSNYKLKVIQRLDKMIKKYGIIKLLKKGLDVENAHFTLFFVSPLASSSNQTKEQFKTNEFSITRQVRYSQANPLLELDMVIFINGLPIITMELKNAWTGQSAKIDGIKQYKKDRDPKEPLLNFARCLVHFTLDTDEIYMTTKLAKEKTFFLPFNRGYNNGKGNPINKHGHKTAYLWEDILTKESLAELIQHFVKLSGKKEKDPLTKKTLFFPRYHQREVVRKIVKHASEHGVGETYLVQHSAGSGKSYSITWAAYQLIETYPSNEKAKGNKALDEPLFDSVIVVTDRRLLDKQIKEDIKSFSEVKNIMAHATSSQDLKNYLEGGKKIIITTIQKFPVIYDSICDLSSKRFAVIIDEAHSSQSGQSHDKMNMSMGSEDSEEKDTQDIILETMRKRKMKGNASYLAFTATPKPTTLEKFGVKQENGEFKPFHLYSMKQAIEEGFILDVLANYTTYKSYYEIVKSIENNPLFDTTKAQKKLKSYVEQHKQTIQTKSEIILDHFIHKTVKSKKLKGKAKGMVVTQSIESAINYYSALKELLKEQNDPFKIIIAFSGKKTINGIDYTESQLNGFATKDIEEKFESDEYRLLVVANKYLTGFDQPKLTSMYIDKKLQGVLAVQALSRLNRSANALGKKTEDLFILDFYNSTDEIKKSFDPFYTATTLSSPTDINVLHELKDNLDEEGIYEQGEVDEFNQLFFSGANGDLLSPIIDTAAQRFNDELGLEDDQKADYKIKAKQFVKIYGQVASIMPYEILSWEKLFWFLKFLIPKMVIKDKEKEMIDNLLNSVDLSTYGLERIKLNETITLDESESELDPQNPNPRGVHEEGSEKDYLETIIQEFNERWFQGWDATPEEQKIKFISTAEKMKQHPDFKDKYLENPDTQNRDLAYNKIFDDVMNQQRRSELDLYRLISQDEAFKEAMQNTLKRILSA